MRTRIPFYRPGDKLAYAHSPGGNVLLWAGDLHPGRAQSKLCALPGFLPLPFVSSSWEIGSLESCECVFRLSDREREEEEEGRVRRRDGRQKEERFRQGERKQRKGSSWHTDLLKPYAYRKLQSPGVRLLGADQTGEKEPLLGQAKGSCAFGFYPMHAPGEEDGRERLEGLPMCQLTY